MKRDERGLIMQLDGDQGDCLANQSRLAIGLALLGNTYQMNEEIDRLVELWAAPGIWRRHWDKSKWYYLTDNVSRDQLIPLIIALSMGHKHKHWMLCRQTISAIIKRGFFAQNTRRGGGDRGKWKLPDSMLPALSVMIRAFMWSYPVRRWQFALGQAALYFTDWLLVIGSIAKVMPWRWSDSKYSFEPVTEDSVDDWTDVVVHLQAAYMAPTFVSEVARAIYAQKRPNNLGNSILKEENPVIGAIRWYTRPQANGNIELAEIFRPTITTFFRRS